MKSKFINRGALIETIGKRWFSRRKALNLRPDSKKEREALLHFLIGIHVTLTEIYGDDDGITALIVLASVRGSSVFEIPLDK